MCTHFLISQLIGFHVLSLKVFFWHWIGNYLRVGTHILVSVWKRRMAKYLNHKWMEESLWHTSITGSQPGVVCPQGLFGKVWRHFCLFCLASNGWRPGMLLPSLQGTEHPPPATWPKIIALRLRNSHMHPTIPRALKYLEDGHWSLEDSLSKSFVQHLSCWNSTKKVLWHFLFPILSWLIPLSLPLIIFQSPWEKMKLCHGRECLESKARLFLVAHLIVARPSLDRSSWR